MTNSVYTTDDVINEIKDAATKASLQVVPYDLKFKNPSTDAIKFSMFFLVSFKLLIENGVEQNALF